MSSISQVFCQAISKLAGEGLVQQRLFQRIVCNEHELDGERYLAAMALSQQHKISVYDVSYQSWHSAWDAAS